MNLTIKSSAPVAIPVTRNDDLVLTNKGPGVLYIDDTPGVSPTVNDANVSVGASVAWRKRVPCWITTDTTTTVESSQNVLLHGGHDNA